MLERYSRSLGLIDERSKASLEKALASVDYTRPVADVRDEVVRIMQTVSGASTSAAARLSAEFYDGLRAIFGFDDGFTALVDSVYDPKATDGAVRALAQNLVDGNVGKFQSGCIERLGSDTRKAANACVAKNAERDPRKPRYARVPMGSETCSFCIMLASRGFVYKNEKMASHAHNDCDCRVVPSWDKSPEVEGYDPDYYLDVYNNPGAHPEVAEARNARRRELYAQRKDETSRPE